MYKSTSPAVDVITDPILNHSVPVKQRFSHTLPPDISNRRLIKQHKSLKLPPSSDKTQWNALNSKFENILNNRIPKSTYQTLSTDELCDSFTTLLREFLESECGVKNNTISKNKKKTHIKKPSKIYQKLRKQKRKLRSAFRKAKREHASKKTLSKLNFLKRSISRAINRIRKKEKSVSDANQFVKSQSAFNANPHRFANRTFRNNKNAKSAPKFNAETCEAHFKKTYSDPSRGHTYTDIPKFHRPKPPAFPFNTKKLTWSEFWKVLKKTSNGSSPGPNGIPYVVYKTMPCCAKYLFMMLGNIIKHKKIPKSFGIAFIILIPKDQNSLDDPSLFRPIACLNVEGKVLWGILARRLIAFCRANGYLPGLLQKGFIPGLAGCIEHTATLYAALRDARLHKHTIVVTWLDLANAYGSVRHHLIQYARNWFHVPKWFCHFVFIHYNSLFAKVVTKDWSTNIIQFLIGVFQGCPASPILFNIVYQLCI